MANRSKDLSSEDRLTTWIRRQLLTQNYHRVGDDAAILPAGPSWAVSTDHQISNIHFPIGLDPALIAHRLLLVNLSDLAAMGAKPTFAFLTLSCPSAFDVKRFFRSLISRCGDFEVELAGGDLARAEVVSAALTVLGKRPEGGSWLRRSNARAGDRLWLGGSLGRSALGRELIRQGAELRGRSILLPKGLSIPPGCLAEARRAVKAHLTPYPQLTLGHWIGQQTRGAAIDISDGLALDLYRLCRESSVGAEIFEDQLPLSKTFTKLAEHLNLSPLNLVLGGGEDYSLLFALSPQLILPRHLGCVEIGSTKTGSMIHLHSSKGRNRLAVSGWDHFTEA